MRWDEIINGNLEREEKEEDGWIEFFFSPSFLKELFS